MKIWVDDIRTPPDDSLWWIAKNSHQAIWMLNRLKDNKVNVDLMSLDHDLGGEDTTRPVVIWMCENNYWPNEVVVHSANPVGRSWLEGMIERYKNGRM